MMCFRTLYVYHKPHTYLKNNKHSDLKVTSQDIYIPLSQSQDLVISIFSVYFQVQGDHFIKHFILIKVRKFYWPRIFLVSVLSKLGYLLLKISIFNNLLSFKAPIFWEEWQQNFVFLPLKHLKIKIIMSPESSDTSSRLETAYILLYRISVQSCNNNMYFKS